MSIAFAPFCLDGFDMDLLTLFPDLREQPLAQEAESTPVWTLGSGRADQAVLAHPATWHSYEGLVAHYWSREPLLERDAQGWVRLPNACVTDDPLWQVTLLAALRDQWVHTIHLTLDGQRWSQYPDYNGVFERLMGHRRGYHVRDASEIRAAEQRVREWLRTAIRRGLQIRKEVPCP